MADISDEDLADPNIKFFCEQNPGWRKVCVLVRIYGVGSCAVLGGTIHMISMEKIIFLWKKYIPME